MDAIKPLPLHQVKIKDVFWSPRQKLVRDAVIPYQWEALNDQVPDVPPSHAIENLHIAAGEASGEFAGRIFQDSDVAKWLEAVSYTLSTEPDPELEQTADELIDLIVRSQQPDGYLNSYFTVAAPEKRWTNLRDWHELYCAGHMIEAAVAYYQATGKRKLLDALSRFADYIGQVFGRGEGQKRGYPGHPELELALVKLYRATGERKHLELSKYFVDERGQEPHYYKIEAAARGEEWGAHWHSDLSYSQAHLPIRQQTTAEGHAVRALYLFSGVVDVALETDDQELQQVCKRLWRNIVDRRMYIIGGVGSAVYGERFTFDYDLPNDRVYAETCANIALVFFAHRLLQAEIDGEYGDVMERALYNGVLSGISLDGTEFFYVNPLEVWPEACNYRHDLRHVKPTRQGWFDCACCPPNLARLIASLGQYVYSQREDTLFVHLFVSGEASFNVNGQQVTLIQETAYPWQEGIRLTVQPAQVGEFTVAARIPGWCRDPKLAVNGETVDLRAHAQRGYAYITRSWSFGDQVELTLPMPVERMEAHPAARANAGKVALQRGPIVYCLEEVDNGPILPAIILPRDVELSTTWKPELLGGAVVVKGKAQRVDGSSWDNKLYRPVNASLAIRPVEITAIPYALWANRQPGEMLVWIRED